jgi:hypothetical protein
LISYLLKPVEECHPGTHALPVMDGHGFRGGPVTRSKYIKVQNVIESVSSLAIRQNVKYITVRNIATMAIV